MQKEQTVKSRKLSWSKGLLALLSLAVLAAGQLLSQSVGTLLSFAQFPVDLCNLAVGVVYVLSVLYGLSWVCKALGLSLADCRILPVHFSLLWTVIALAMPGIVCLILLNLPGSWEVALFSHEQLAALLSAAVCVIGLWRRQFFAASFSRCWNGWWDTGWLFCSLRCCLPPCI